MIIMMKERHAHEKKEYYKTCCPKCESTFAFSSDDLTKDVDNHEVVKCPICSREIPHYYIDYEAVHSNFWTISRWRYNRIIKKYKKD